MIPTAVRTVDVKQPLLSAQSMRSEAGDALPLGLWAQSRAQSAAQTVTTLEVVANPSVVIERAAVANGADDQDLDTGFEAADDFFRGFMCK